MARQEKTFIPLSEVNQNTARIEFYFSLPKNIDANELGFDVEKMEKLMDDGGIKNLEILGIDAIHTKEKVRATSFKVQSDRPKSNKIHISDTYANGKIHVNMQPRSRREMTTSDWASYMDKALRNGITNIGVKYLLSGASRREQIEQILSDGAAGILIGGGFMVDTRWGLAAVGLKVGGEIMRNISGRLFPNSDNLYRLSFFPACQIDRAAILAVKANTTTLVKELPTRRS